MPVSVLSVLLGQVFVRKLLAFAGSSVLLYDYIITFSLEVAYIWNAPWTLVKAGFLINRYGNLLGQTYIMLEETGYLSHDSQEFCTAFWTYCGFFAVFSKESIRILVLMRAWTIWGCKRGAAVLLVTLYLLHILAVCVTLANGVKQGNSLLLDELGLCFSAMPSQSWLVWFGALSIDALTLPIVCYSLLKLTRESRGLRPSLLVRLLVRDAFMFYFASLLCGVFSVICLIVFRQDPRNFIQITFLYPFMSVIGQRLVLNLRGLRVRPDSTRDWSQEVDRQMAAMDNLEQSWDLEGSGNDGMVELQLLGDGDAQRAPG